MSYLSDNDLALHSADPILCNAWTRDESNPFLGGSTTSTSDPTSQDRGS